MFEEKQRGRKRLIDEIPKATRTTSPLFSKSDRMYNCPFDERLEVVIAYLKGELNLKGVQEHFKLTSRATIYTMVCRTLARALREGKISL